VTAEDRTVAAHAAATILSQQNFFRQSQHIACYLPNNQEFDSLPIIQLIWAAKKKCYLPVLNPDKTLSFSLYEEGDALYLNVFSIPEPVNISRQIAATNLDLVITPLIAFDQAGHRVGSGGGYYDRTFAFLHENARKKPLMIGLAYALQQIENFSPERWDVKLDGVLTEKTLLTSLKKNT